MAVCISARALFEVLYVSRHVPIVLVVVLRPRLFFGVVRAKLSPVAFSVDPSSILANRVDPQPRTKDDDEGRGGLEHDAKRRPAVNQFKWKV